LARQKVVLEQVRNILPGYPLPLGVHLHNEGAQFNLFSRNASGVALLLFDHAEDLVPFSTIELDQSLFRTGDIWHVWVKGVKAGCYYAYRVRGPYKPRQGHRFNRHKLVLDPYAKSLSQRPVWDFNRAKGYDSLSFMQDLSLSNDDNIDAVPRCVIVSDTFDWQGDTRPRRPWSETIIYETHVRGLTVHSSSGVAHPGAFRGVLEKIPHFKELGVTALELLPIQEFNENELDTANPLTGEPLKNYWGYSTVGFFAPEARYTASKADGAQVVEFKEMVRELHKAGIEVILDVVFNHTAEGDERGPTISFRGLDNSIYYMPESNKRFYKNYSGCGNTLNCNHPVVRQFIVDCLTYWVLEMHVDGFRFDLASVMGRDQEGLIMKNPPLLEEIAEHPVLRHTKLIAEAWDAAGAYQVGSFPGHLWSEWNGRFRDDVRRFWRGDPGMITDFASRICGSADIYQRSGKDPVNSINFVTCHDGFTLNDLVSYNQKHNEANGQDGSDGTNADYSYNHGVEGPTNDPDIERVRLRQIKNMIATLFFSRGVPLFLGGDEFRRSQQGNNNAFCQDNEVSWYNWELAKKNKDVFRFTSEMIRFRNRHAALREVNFYTDHDIAWYNWDGGNPDWGPENRSLTCMIFGEEDLYLMVHADFMDRTFNVPAARNGKAWHVAIDTSKPSPLDVNLPGEEKMLKPQDRCMLFARSLVILIAR
jgi:isoamylase